MKKIPKTKDQNEKDSIELFKRNYPHIQFDESLPQDQALAEFIVKAKEYKKKNTVVPVEKSTSRKVLENSIHIFMMTFFRNSYIKMSVGDSEYERIKYHSSFYNFISGAIMLSLSMYIATTEVLTRDDYHFFSDTFFGGLLKWLSTIVVLVWFCIGMTRVVTLGRFLTARVSGSSSSDSSFINLDRAISYRNSRLNGLTGMEAADLLAKTAVLDAAKNGNFGNDPSTKRAMSYLDSKMGGMSGFDGVDYLAGKK